MGIKLKLEFDCNNSSFNTNEEFYAEIARVLKQTADITYYFNSYGNLNRKFEIPLVDINGNKIGFCKTVRTNKIKEKK